jgi:hypothetical protein
MLKVFDMARKRRKFTKEYKAEVVKLVREGGNTTAGPRRLEPFIPGPSSGSTAGLEVRA